MITGAAMGVDGGKAVTEGGGPFVVQKFVKSKGPHAFIIRQVKYFMREERVTLTRACGLRRKVDSSVLGESPPAHQHRSGTDPDIGKHRT